MAKNEERDGTVKRGRKRRFALRVGMIAVAMAATTMLVYVSGTNSVAVHFYYLPILYAGFTFGDLGALAATLVAALLCGPWVPASIEIVGEDTIRHQQQTADILVRGGVFLVMGFFASRVSSALHRRAMESGTLYEVSSTVAKSLRLNEVLGLITESAVSVIDARACSIRLLDADSGELRPGGSSGLSGAYWSKGKVTVQDSLLDQRVLAGEAVMIRNAQTDPLFQYPDAAHAEGLTSVLSLPLASKGNTLGVIRIYARRQRDFAKREVRLLRAFADAAAVAIENAQLYEDVRQNYFETVRALTIAIEARDSATYSHSERVTEIADQLAVEMGVGEHDREMLRFGCILHDIGRIGIDERPAVMGGATQEEMAFYQMHPLIGRSILQPVRFLEEIMPIVVHHHERWDGSGFPEGLVEEQTEFLPRLVGVVDTYERLVNPQETVSPMSPRDAMREILRGSGKTFDPEIVAAFARVMREEIGSIEGDEADDLADPAEETAGDADAGECSAEDLQAMSLTDLMDEIAGGADDSVDPPDASTDLAEE